jgi:hypothetical protein
MGWFYGFKLHLVVNRHGEIVAAKVTTGNVHDTQPVAELAEGLTDKLYGDKGYLRVVFEISVMRHMETDNNCHHFAGCHSATTLTFLGAVFEQLFLPLGDKYVAKIIDIAKQLN